LPQFNQGGAAQRDAHRNGGAYCNPPLVQSWFRLRGTPSGAIDRSQTSP
jgi:hypothetical protein